MVLLIYPAAGAKVGLILPFGQTGEWRDRRRQAACEWWCVFGTRFDRPSARQALSTQDALPTFNVMFNRKIGTQLELAGTVPVPVPVRYQYVCR